MSIRWLFPLLILWLTACQPLSDAPVEEWAAPESIPGTSWTVSQIDDGSGALVDVLDGTELTAHFNREKSEGGHVTGFAGCNEYVADYDVAGPYLGIGIDLTTTTDNFCNEPAGIMAQEEAYLAALGSAYKWSLDDSILTFLSGDASPVVLFEHAGPVEPVSEDRLSAPSGSHVFNYIFDEGDEGWAAGFVDLPVDFDPAIYDLDSEWRALPDTLDGFGIYMQGHNRSDDLFMYLFRQVDGLEPGTTYDAQFRLDLASNVPQGLVGIGGSPGESVYVKAGASTIEPERVEDEAGWWRLNIDKGNQATGGEDMIVLGTLGNPNLTAESAGTYASMTLDSMGSTFEVTADENGSVWFIVGTDSGFEGLTALYYDTISVALTQGE